MCIGFAVNNENVAYVRGVDDFVHKFPSLWHSCLNNTSSLWEAYYLIHQSTKLQKGLVGLWVIPSGAVQLKRCSVVFQFRFSLDFGYWMLEHVEKKWLHANNFRYSQDQKWVYANAKFLRKGVLSFNAVVCCLQFLCRSHVLFEFKFRSATREQHGTEFSSFCNKILILKAKLLTSQCFCVVVLVALNFSALQNVKLAEISLSPTKLWKIVFTRCEWTTSSPPPPRHEGVGVTLALQITPPPVPVLYQVTFFSGGRTPIIEGFPKFPTSERSDPTNCSTCSQNKYQTQCTGLNGACDRAPFCLGGPHVFRNDPWSFGVTHSHSRASFPVHFMRNEFYCLDPMRDGRWMESLAFWTHSTMAVSHFHLWARVGFATPWCWPVTLIGGNSSTLPFFHLPKFGFPSHLLFNMRGFMLGPCNLQIWVPWLG